MFLQKIILKNFKSFYKKSVIELPNQITAIVGPNGSGKSNIVDAIRWALGEQSFKNIRVEKGSNLIFRGRDKSAAFAEVELIFDNSKRIFPLDFSEVSILRRITKDEVNSYYLNHQPCRLKDITETILAAKLGLKGFSIINQGAVENILRVTPYERRLMLEENLGLKNLEIKKEYSKKKLESTITNLEKVQAQIKEIIPHLRFLKRQVKHWEERKENEQKLKERQKEYFSLCYFLLLRAEQPPVEEQTKLENQIKSLERDITEIKAKLGLAKDSLKRKLEQQIALLTQEIFSLQQSRFTFLEKIKDSKSQEQNNLDIHEVRHKLVFFQEELKKLLQEETLEKIKAGIQKIIDQISSLLFTDQGKNKRSETDKRDDDFYNKLQSIEKEIAKKKQRLSELQEQLAQRSKSFQEKFSLLEKKQEEKEQLIQKLHSIEIKQEKYNLRLQDLKRRVQGAGLNWSEIEVLARDYSREQDISATKEKLEKSISRLERIIESTGVIDENTLKEYQDVQERYNFLNQQIKDLTTAAQDLKSLIRELTSQIETKFQSSLHEINKHFNRYFRLMFQGGSAHLVIKKEQKEMMAELGKVTERSGEHETQELSKKDIMDEKKWGIEIKVDIPKTKLKTLEALSGGEKSLTAIALLFAIVNQSNPPLVIVDEIDAALDEENSRRFAKILRELSQETQFIVVTHNRLVMASASTIYGVTLKDNISCLYSIKLEGEEMHQKANI